MSVITQQPIAAVERKGLSRGWIIAIVAAGGAGLVVLTLLAVGVVFVFGAAMDMFADQVRRDIQGNPVIREHIGTIEEIEIDYAATSNETGAEVFVFRVTGSDGRGRLTVNTVTVDGTTEKVSWGRLEHHGGETYDLFPGQGAKPQ